MKDGTLMRCVSIGGGIVLITVSAVAGVDGDMRALAYALIGLGVGAGVGSGLTARIAVKYVRRGK